MSLEIVLIKLYINLKSYFFLKNSTNRIKLSPLPKQKFPEWNNQPH